MRRLSEPARPSGPQVVRRLLRMHGVAVFANASYGSRVPVRRT